jgi:hypothetical protein
MIFSQNFHKTDKRDPFVPSAAAKARRAKNNERFLGQVET